MSRADDLLRNAESYARRLSGRDRPAPPPKPTVAVVTCMDARINVYALLGLRDGDAHIIRNAGGAVTDDTIRSLAISQRLLGTEEILLIHHTRCGMLTFTDDGFRAQIEQETGIRPGWAAEAFVDLEDDVRQSIRRIHSSPFIPRKNARGFVFDVESGDLREIR